MVSWEEPHRREPLCFRLSRRKCRDTLVPTRDLSNENHPGHEVLLNRSNNPGGDKSGGGRDGAHIGGQLSLCG